MSKENNDSQKIILGLIISGIVGAGLIYSIKAANRKTPVMQRIGKTISEFGEMIENCDCESSCSEVIHKVEKNLPKGKEVVDTALDWLSLGMSLLNKFKKAR